MGCEEVRASLQVMMSGHELGDGKALVMEHLEHCTACQAFHKRENEIESFLPRTCMENRRKRPAMVIVAVLMFFALYSTILLLSNGSRADIIKTQEEKFITEFIVSWKDEKLLSFRDRIDESNFMMIMSGISEKQLKSVDRITLKERSLTEGEYSDIGRFDIEGRLENDSTFDYTVTLGQRRDGGGLFLIRID